VGCSAKFIRDEIAAGQIMAIRIGRKNRFGSRLLISRAEAHRYCKSLGVSDDSLPPAIAALWNLMTATPTAACLIKDGITVAANRALVELSGYALKELVGAKASSFTADPDHHFSTPPTVARHADRVAMRHKTGTAVETLVTRLPVVAEGAHYVLALITPVDR
jgi:PAS domain-containing protein